VQALRCRGGCEPIAIGEFTSLADSIVADPARLSTASPEFASLTRLLLLQVEPCVDEFLPWTTAGLGTCSPFSIAIRGPSRHPP
jgi:hypothetical protein